MRLIAGERHFVIVVVEILRFESAAAVLAFIHDLFVDPARVVMRQIEFRDGRREDSGGKSGFCSEVSE